MDTRQEQLDTKLPPTDPALDALLDEALSYGSPPANPAPGVPPELAERIIAKTLPMLKAQPVLARISPTLLRVAAAVTIVAGAGIVAVMWNTQPTQTTEIDTLVKISSQLKELDLAIEPGNTLIDEQLDVLALRVDLVSTEDVWGAADQDTNAKLGEAVARFEFDRFSDDAMLLLADGSTLF